jgi:outer membrane biosynthesis protein TonB
MWWKSMKTKLLFGVLLIGFCLIGEAAIAQTAGDFFNRAARSYVKTAKEQALREVNDGLAKYPNDAKLKALKEKLEQEQQQEEQEQQQDQQQQNQQNQQQKDPSQKEDSKSDQKDGEKTNEDKAKEGQKGENPSQQSEEAGQNANDQMDANLADRQKKMEAMREKLKGMNLSPEQAAQILESLNAAELRYIQDNKKKATQQPKRGLPDW